MQEVFPSTTIRLVLLICTQQDQYQNQQHQHQTMKLKHSYTTMSAGRWSSISITPKQLLAIIKDMGQAPEDAGYYDAMFLGNPLDGQSIMITYESNTNEQLLWEERNKETLNYPEAPASSHERMLDWVEADDDINN
jgi:hypothetical protein